MLETSEALNFASPPRRRVAIRMAPLIDIVFLLICFYLLVAELIRSQKDPTVALPAMAHAAAGEEVPAEVVVNLRADATVTVNGVEVAERLTRLLRAERAKAARTSQPFRVVVRADRRQRFGRLDEVLVACKRAGLATIVFRAREVRLR
jgi:biopolymer transport protein ExbD